MILSNTMHRALCLVTLIHSLIGLVLSTPAELDKRLKCNQDNCLRALLANKRDLYIGLYRESHRHLKRLFLLQKHRGTSTTTTTTALPTPTQCSAANNYGYGYDYNTFSFKSQYIFFNGAYSNGRPGDCCAKCYATPGCYSFSEIYDTTDPSYDHWCELGMVAGGSWPDVSTQCPLGRATGPDAGHLTPEPAGVMSGANLGPCGAG